MVWSESGENSAQIKHRLQAKTALNRFWCKRQQEMDFFTEGSVIMDKKLCFSQKQRFEVKNILMDLFQLLKMLTWCLWCF